MTTKKEAKYRSEFCWVCSAPLTQPPSGRSRKTCSDKCRQRMYRENVKYKAWRLRDQGYYSPKDRAKIARELKRQYPRMSEECMAQIRLGGPVARCEACGTPYVQSNPREQYCSQACRSTVQQERVWRRERGLWLDPKPGQALSAYVENLLDRGIKVAFCPVCGLYITPEPGKTGRPKTYCSAACRSTYQNQMRPVRRCACCGRRYRQKKGKWQQRYCSASCRIKHWKRAKRAAEKADKINGKPAAGRKRRRTETPVKQAEGRGIPLGWA